MVWQAVAGIAGAIGSLFGGSKQSEEERTTVTESRVDYKRLVRDAQRAGINPLTALRTGGAAGFTTQTTTTPPLASQSLIGRIASATGQIAEGLSNQQVWEASQQKLDLDRRLVEAQINNLRQPSTGPQGPRIGGPAMGQPGPPGMFHGPGSPGAPGSGPPMNPTQPNPGQVVPGWLWQQTPEGGYLLGPNPEAPVEFETDAWWWARRGVFFEEMDKVIQKNVPGPRQTMQNLTEHIMTTDPFPGSGFGSPQDQVDLHKKMLKDGYEWWKGAFDRTKQRFGPGGSAWTWDNWNPLSQPREPLRR